MTEVEEGRDAGQNAGKNEAEATGTKGPPAGSLPARYEPVFAIFEGGGAKGITHIGALKAMEQERLALVGVAGTSAGAIVAALAAVGYKADELINPDTSADILKDLGYSPVRVLGSARWAALGLMRRLALPLLILFMLSTLLLVIATGGLLLIEAAEGLASDWPRTAVALSYLGPAAVFLWASSAALMVLLSLPPILRRGIFSSEKLSEALNLALRRKLKEHREALGITEPVPEKIRFADIDPTVMPRCAPLKIIVTDVRSGRLALFDREDPCVVVADAVAASAAIPFAFAPPAIEGAPSDGSPVYADGGLVSNLPAWSFAVEKRALEREQRKQAATGQQNEQPIPILAFSLNESAAPRDDETAVPAMSMFSYVQRVLMTGIFGSQVVVEEFIPDLHQIELETPLDTMSFDCTRVQANAAYKSGLVSAQTALRRRRLTRQLTDELLTEIHAAVVAIIRANRTAAVAPAPHIRVFLIDPSGPRRRPTAEFRVLASVGARDHADDRLAIDPRNLAAPQAFAQRKAVFATVQNQPAEALWMTKYEHALVWPEVCSIICIPVFGKRPEGLRLPPPQRVLCIDSSDSLQGEFNDPTFMQTLTDMSVNLSRTLIEKVVG